MWIDEVAPPRTPGAKSKCGHPRLNSNGLIQALLGLKILLRPPLCAQQGFAHSLRHLSYAQLHNAVSPRASA